MNIKTPEEIGEYISALSNGACLRNEPFGYLVFGIKDGVHSIEGTTFPPGLFRVGKEELENWLSQRLSPGIEFEIYEFYYDEKLISLFKIRSARNRPVYFQHQHFIRVGSIKRYLKYFPEKERKIW